MNIIKSLLVFVLLVALVVACIVCVIRCINEYKRRTIKKTHIFITLCCICVTIPSLVCFDDYVFPFEQTLDPVLIAEFDVPEGYELEYPGQKFWHGAYEEFGLYAESFYFDPDNSNSIYGFGWPPMNFDQYCYIITYGQKIQTLSYNVWETIDEPIRTGAKVGHMILDEEFAPDKVYVYQIPKVRIENDINDINRKWD